tara:strand:- start:226 stop:429 length:204 start_codon:yes stop_codon:yes gene_type:complete
METLLSTKLIELLDMPDPDALWRDIQKIDDLYEELLWHPDDELQFSIEYLNGNGRVVITNKTLENES